MAVSTDCQVFPAALPRPSAGLRGHHARLRRWLHPVRRYWDL